MATHKQINRTFKQSPWSGVTQSVGKLFSPANLKQDVGLLLDFVIEQIDRSNQAWVRKNLFRLVNVYSVGVQRSIGFMEPPHEDIIRSDAELVLTFSITSKPVKKTPKIVSTKFTTETTQEWSPVQGPVEYLTITIDKQRMLKMRSLKYDSLDDVLYLYQILGIATKNFIQTGGLWYNARKEYPAPSLPDEIVKTKYFEKPIKDLVRTVPMPYWAYNVNVWQQATNILLPQTMGNDTFKKYFVLYLLESLGPTLSKEATEFVDGTGSGSLHDFVMQGLRDVILEISRPTGRINDSMIAVLHLLNNAHNGEGLLSSAQSDVEVEIEYLARKLDADKDIAAIFFSLFTDLPKSAKDLIEGSTRFQPVLEELLS